MVQLLVSTIKNDGLDGQTGFFAREREGMDTVEALSTWSQGRQDQQEDSRPFGFFFFGSLRKICTNSSLTIWSNSPINLSCPELLFVESF